MNGCAVVVVLMVAMAALLVPVTIVVLWRRVQDQEQKIRALQERFAQLSLGIDERVTALERHGTTATTSEQAAPESYGDEAPAEPAPAVDDPAREAPAKDARTEDVPAQGTAAKSRVIPTPLPPEPAYVATGRLPDVPGSARSEADPKADPDADTPAQSPPEQPAETRQPGSPSPWPKVDWEQWIGVRGFAVLGGVVLALAGLLFVKDLAERGFFPPPVRVTLAFLVGIGAVFGSERLRPKGYAVTANALTGAGVVILYGATWAASRLFDLIGYGVAFALMALVTSAAGLLAWHHRSTVIAVLGLLGGFVTPLLLGSGFDHPIGLFGYLLLLNGGALFLVRRRRWPVLGLLGLVASGLYFAGWTAADFGASDRPLALILLALFSTLFALVGYQRGEADEADQRKWSWLRAAGLVVPFLFALHFAARADLGEHLAPVAALIALLSFAAGWLEQRGRLPVGTTGTAAAASLAVFTVWLWEAQFAGSTPRGHGAWLAWEANGIAIGLAAVFFALLMLQWRARTLEPSVEPPALTPLEALPTALLAVGALFQIAARPILRDTTLWPWLVGMIGLSLILVRTASVPRLGWLLPTAAGLMGFGNVVLANEQHAPLSPGLYYGLIVALAVGWMVLALVRDIRSLQSLASSPEIRAAVAGAVAHPMIVLAGLLPLIFVAHPPTPVFLATLSALAMLATLAITRLGSGKLYLALVALVSVVLTFWYSAERWEGWALAVHVLLVVGFSFWPFVSTRALAARRGALYGAALAGPLSFPILHERFVSLFGDDAIGILPLTLATISLAAAVRARRALPLASPPGTIGPARLRSQVWLLATTLGLVALAVPLQLSEEWWTIAWALQGAAMLGLWRRLDHPGLKYFGVLLLAAATARLLINPALLGYHRNSGWPIVNWLLYTYWIPAASLLVALRLLRPAEAARGRPFEAGLYRSNRPILGLGCGLAAIVVIFAWINLTIFDLFADGSLRSISFAHQPARELSLSLAWAVYALCLLGLGLRRQAASLRWISLVVLLLTIVKVFLYDLGQLDGLYRVGSLAGLAISLLLVSLAYQRFVFTPRSEKP